MTNVREYEACVNSTNGRPKRRFKNRRAAEKQARKAPIKLYVYHCRYCDGWHHTHETQRNKPAPAPPSAKTLRRHLESLGRDIAAAERRLAKAEQKRAEENIRAAQRQAQMEREHAEELAAIAVMMKKAYRV